MIQNGIRMTGMPAFGETYDDEKLWQVTLLLAHAHDLPASVRSLLVQPDAVPLIPEPSANAAQTKRR